MSDLEGSNDIDPLRRNLTRDIIYFSGKIYFRRFCYQPPRPSCRVYSFKTNNVSRLSARPRVLCLCACQPRGYHLSWGRGRSGRAVRARTGLITSKDDIPLVDGRGAVRLMRQVDWTWLSAAASGARGDHGLFEREMPFAFIHESLRHS
jgi:hypothetical protein